MRLRAARLQSHTMNQQLSDAWFALEGESEWTPEAAGSRIRLPAGHAWIVTDEEEDNQLMLLACEGRDKLERLLQHVQFHLRVRANTVMIDDLAVPVVMVLLRIQQADEQVLFSAWVNELSPRNTGILKEMTEQSQLLIALVDEDGRTVGTCLARNVLTSRMESLRGWISKLAENRPWTRHQFAAAKAYIRSMYPTNEELWARFDEDSASEIRDRELAELTA
jgi:hypothetical protein